MTKPNKPKKPPKTPCDHENGYYVVAERNQRYLLTCTECGKSVWVEAAHLRILSDLDPSKGEEPS